MDLLLNIELKPKRPVIIVATTGFLAYAGLIPLLFLLLPTSQANVGLTSKMLIGLTLAAMVALLLRANRPGFYLTRAALAGWLISALISVGQSIWAPDAYLSPGSPGQVTQIIGAVIVALLFYFFSFGKTSHAYFQLASAAPHPESTPSAQTEPGSQRNASQGSW